MAIRVPSVYQARLRPRAGGLLRRIKPRPAGLLPAALQSMPDFIIIGAQRAGTTSLYRYLAEHPDILPASHKEVHFFDFNYNRGLRWYRSHFPSSLSIRRLGKRDAITGESTPYYLVHPLVPPRVASHLPDVRLIILLRNPIDRAFSHYRHECVLGRESLSFADALTAEESRIEGESPTSARADPDAKNAQRFSYLTRGRYADQLDRWLRHFKRDQILILRAEDQYSDPDTCLRRVHRFLGRQERALSSNRVHNASPPGESAVSPAVREHLAAYFRPHNMRLYQLLGVDFGWD